jgi:hypothetical protein
MDGAGDVVARREKEGQVSLGLGCHPTELSYFLFKMRKYGLK